MLYSNQHLLPSDTPDRNGPRKPPIGPLEDRGDELRYRVELWDRAGNIVEGVLAVLASVSIGYAAFYAATRDYPDRMIVFRDGKHTLMRWKGNPH